MEAKKAEIAAKKAAKKAAEEAAWLAEQVDEDGNPITAPGGGTGEEGGEGGPSGEGSGDGSGAGGIGGGDAEALLKALPKAPPPRKGKGGEGKGGAGVGGKSQAAQLPSVNGVLCSSDDLPFFQRTGTYAAKRKTMNMDIRIDGIRMCAGKQELLDHAVLALNYGRNYGLVGRNGVGKTTLLRHLAEGVIRLPDHIKVVHVEQEIAGDERSALDTIVQADGERAWLLQVENALVEGDDRLETQLGITLQARCVP